MSTFPAFALVADSDWLMQVSGGDDVSTISKIRSPAMDDSVEQAREGSRAS